jgi:hypothetical protein
MANRELQRIQVHIVQVRAVDVLPGDVVNKNGAVREGWIEIAYTEPLPDGRINLCDETYRRSFVSDPLDLVWLQIAGVLRGNSHIPVDVPMFFEPVRARAVAEPPPSAASEEQVMELATAGIDDG